MPTWATPEVEPSQKAHAFTVVFKETTDDGKQYVYRITGSTIAEIKAKFKAEVLAARALRAKIAQVVAGIDPATIETFLNS